MNNDLYTDFFDFSERPFTLLPDPDFLFWTPAHRRAYSVLEYGVVMRSPLTVITGEVGTGKTTLVQHLLHNMGDHITVGLISNAQGDRGDLMRWVLNAFEPHMSKPSDYVDSFQRFQDFVVEEYAAGNHVVLVIDEAQNLSIEALEELRLLTNINANKDELLQLFLVGQPELRQIIQLPELRQFAQRVTTAYHMSPLDLETTSRYIRHRLQHVGGTGDEVTAAAVTLIYEETGGIPRLINKLCDLSLVYAASDNSRKVGVELVRELIQDGLFIRTNELAPYRLTVPIDPLGAAE